MAPQNPGAPEPIPRASAGAVETAGIRSDVYTYFTRAGVTDLLLSLPQWSLVTFRLESPGPVSIGSREDLRPVGSGKGRLLPADEDIKVVMVPLTRIYITADSIQRVSVQVEPYPWLVEILNSIKMVGPQVANMLARALRGGR